MSDRSTINQTSYPKHPGIGGQGSNSSNWPRHDVIVTEPPANVVQHARHGESGDFMDTGPDSSTAMPTHFSQPQVVSQLVPYGQDRTGPMPEHAPTGGASSHLSTQLVTPTVNHVNPMLASANSRKFIAITMVAGLEDDLIAALGQGTCWQRAQITIKQELRHDVLLELDQALAAARKQRIISILDGSPTGIKPPSLPLGGAITFDVINVRERQTSPDTLVPLLECPNPALRAFGWSGTSDTISMVQALQRGSHELTSLGMSPVPEDGQAFRAMLSQKTRLQELILGRGIFDIEKSQLGLRHVLLAAPTVTELHLDFCLFCANSFAGCAQAFSQSRLEHFSLCQTRFAKGFDDNSLKELAQGLSRAPNLAKLSFDGFKSAEENLRILVSFGSNPAARTFHNANPSVCVYQPHQLDELNRQRQGKGWPLLQFE